jgi:hypothetical protein
MKMEEFKKGIGEFKEARLTAAEERAMLESVFKAPIESPYFAGRSLFNIFQQPLAAALIIVFVSFAGTSLAYAAERSVPGEALYAIKTKVFEPILDRVNISPIEKLEWEEKKVERRIMEAEELAKDNELDEEKTLELEKKIGKSSAAFSAAAQKVASSTATTTSGRDKKVDEFKKAFREKLDKESAGAEDKEKGEMIKRLKDKASKSLDEGEANEGKGNSKKDR